MSDGVTYHNYLGGVRADGKPDTKYLLDFRRMVVEEIDDRRPSNVRVDWYDLFKLSGLPLDRTVGDGMGRFTQVDKALILSELGRQAEAVSDPITESIKAQARPKKAKPPKRAIACPMRGGLPCQHADCLAGGCQGHRR
jgi:hypothetical protein